MKFSEFDIIIIMISICISQVVIATTGHVVKEEIACETSLVIKLEWLGNAKMFEIWS